MEFALEVQNVFFRIDDRVIFQDLSLGLRRGEAYFLLGASGGGKSLLLKICAGLLAPEKGKVIIGGMDLVAASRETIQEIRAKIGFVFQDSALISNMAIFDNLALPLRYHRRISETEVRERVEEKMALFGVDRSLERSIPAQLSLEMRKRAALARALVLEPEILLLDQPTDGLGAEEDSAIGRVLKDYRQRAGASLLEVGSEWPPSSAYSDRVGILEAGRIAAEGTFAEMQTCWAKGKKPYSPS